MVCCVTASHFGWCAELGLVDDLYGCGRLPEMEGYGCLKTYKSGGCQKQTPTPSCQHLRAKTISAAIPLNPLYAERETSRGHKLPAKRSDIAQGRMYGPSQARCKARYTL